MSLSVSCFWRVLSAQRIFQDLVYDKVFEGSYESVKRYVRKIEQVELVPFRRIEVLPGTECQVDYGQGAWVVGADGKRRKTHLFRVGKRYQPKKLRELVFDTHRRQLSSSFHS
jgi:hypothetical protein